MRWPDEWCARFPERAVWVRALTGDIALCVDIVFSRFRLGKVMMLKVGIIFAKKNPTGYVHTLYTGVG